MIHCKSETQVYCFAFRTFFLSLMPPKCGSVAKVRHKTQQHAFRVLDRPTCLTFYGNKMSNNAEWINSENLFFHPSRLMCSLSMLQCYLYCEGNVCANRMQSDESWLSKAMLRCSLTSPKAMSVQTECRATRAGSQKLCWGAAWLRRRQRYNMHNPKSNFFRRLISHLENFTRSKMGIKPFIYGLSDAFSDREKK